MKRWIFCALSILFTLAVCFRPSETVGSEEKAASLEKNIKNEFRVLDISERTYDGGSAIAIILSAPLDPTLRHDDHIRISDSENLLTSVWVLSDDGRTLYYPNVSPETSYSVTVLETLTAAAGESLNQRVSQTVTTRALHPVISFASEGFLLPPKMTKGLPVVTINIPSIFIEFFRLNDSALVHFVNWSNTGGSKGYYSLKQVKDTYGEFVYSGKFDLTPPPNKRVIRYIDVENVEALQEPGIYMAVMREPGEYDYDYKCTYFVVTDIALHARVYKDQSLIFASSLKTGKPIPKTQLTFYNNKGNIVKKSVTDEFGKFEYKGRLSSDIYFIKAKYENYVGILPLRIPALDISNFDLGKRVSQLREIYTYSPRDLYRPGETVIVSALLRNYDGNPVEALPIKAHLYRPDGRDVKSFTWHAKDLGESKINYYQTRFDLPKDAQTGQWHLKLYDNPSAKTPTNTFSFHVEEFLPERMKLTLTSNQEFLTPEEKFYIDVAGQYLYGAPAAGNDASAQITVKAKRELFDDLKGFEFGDIQDESYSDYWQEEDIKLNNQGIGVFGIESRWKKVSSPLAIRSIISLYESGGRPVTRSITRQMWPAESLIGIRPLFDDHTTDEGPIKFEIVKRGQDGQLIAQKGLSAELTREDRDYFWEYSESEGWQYRYTEKNYQYLTDIIDLKEGQPTPYALHLERGRYVLSVKDIQTGLTSSIRFYVGSYWWGKDETAAAHPDKVLLQLDKASYRVGDIIDLTVTAPHAGEGFVLVESDKPLWTKKIQASPEGVSVKIPIPVWWDSHDIYISAVVFRPADAEEKITPNRAVGLVYLPLDRTERKLNISVDAPEKVAPEGPMTVKVKLDQQVDTPVFVTLAAVDVGILSITDFETPDPYTWFFEQRRYEVDSYDIYSKVIEFMEGDVATLRYGGDADLTGGKRPDSKVELVSLFHSPVIFDKNKEAEITFDLPDFNGKLRLMAVAFDQTRFGSTESEVTVRAPIVTQLSTPRFVSPGDQTEFALDVHNLSGAEKNIDIVLTATEPLTIENGITHLTLADQEKTTLRFPVNADNLFSPSQIRLSLVSENISISRNWQIGTRPGYPALARKVRSVLKEDKRFSLDKTVASDMIPETVSAHLKISPVLSLDLNNAMKGLIQYPYGCLEQTSSRAYPLLYATEERIQKFHMVDIGYEERIKRLENAIERLASMQLASGGFGLWNKNSAEEAWLTAFVSDLLLTSRDMGLNVPNQMLEDALRRLEDYLQNGGPMPDYGFDIQGGQLQFSVRCYAAYVLAKLKKAPLGTLRILYDNHQKEAGSCLPLTHLGIALKAMGDNKRSTEAIRKAMKLKRTDVDYWGDYGSDIRDMALTIALLIDHGIDKPDGFGTLMLALEDALRNRQWLSTQEKYAIFRAGLSLDAINDKSITGRLSIGDKTSDIDIKGAFLTSLTAKDIENGVVFESQMTDMVFISAVISGYTVDPPQKDDSQIAVFRDLYDINGNLVTDRHFNVGDLYLVHIGIKTDRWIPDALVVDLTPAGFELENLNLKHGFKLDDIKIKGDKDIWRLKGEAYILHEEYRDDRYTAAVRLNDYQPTHLFYLVRVVSPGNFFSPPVLVESMYKPEIRGISATPERTIIINKAD